MDMCMLKCGCNFVCKSKYSITMWMTILDAGFLNFRAHSSNPLHAKMELAAGAYTKSVVQCVTHAGEVLLATCKAALTLFICGGGVSLFSFVVEECPSINCGVVLGKSEAVWGAVFIPAWLFFIREASYSGYMSGAERCLSRHCCCRHCLCCHCLCRL